MAEKHGISLKTINRAKQNLGVISNKRGGQWFWEMPIDVVYTECRDDSQGGQDGQAQNVTALTILPGRSEAV
jgi:hypothetical protein